MEQAILSWLNGTWLHFFVNDNPPVFGIFETIHFIGLCILFGSIMIVDLRLLGFMRGMPLRAVLKFIPVVIVGFSLNVISGLAFMCADPFNYWGNPAFKLKMFLIVLAGLNAIWFTLAEEKKILAMPDGAATDTLTKISAAASLIFWLSIITIGRMLPTFEVG